MSRKKRKKAFPSLWFKLKRYWQYNTTPSSKGQQSPFVAFEEEEKQPFFIHVL
jgi:hypothetical protein